MSNTIDIARGFKEWCRLHSIVDSLVPQGEPTIRLAYRALDVGVIPPLNLAVFPAAFNPPTLAHVELLFAAEAKIKPSELLLLLDKKTIDKELYGASLEDRLLMLELLAQGRKKTSVALSSHGLFVDKVKALRKLYPEDARLYFIIGYDTLTRLLDPKYYENLDEALKALFAESHFLVANRGKSDEASMMESLSMPQNRKYKRYIEPIRIRPRAAAISSTMVRERVDKGEEISSLVPCEIENFIREAGLYQATEKGVASGPDFHRNKYQIRCDILRHLLYSPLPAGEDIDVRELTEAAIKGEEIRAVIEKFLKQAFR